MALDSPIHTVHPTYKYSVNILAIITIPMHPRTFLLIA